MTQQDEVGLIGLRRALHRHPEPAWCEYETTARILEALEPIGPDTVHVGSDALEDSARLAVPPDPLREQWIDRAQESDVDSTYLEQVGDGPTGLIAEQHGGEGPTVAVRVDIDGLRREESTASSHTPAAEGFRSEHDGLMHACGHDAHAAIGVGVFERIASSAFEGSLKLVFQPAEEAVGGGNAIAKSGHLDDVDALLALHVGLDHPTGTVVSGIDGFLAVEQFHAEFAGSPAHAGGAPEQGQNAMQAMANAIQNLYAISRHSDGPTRVNVGRASGGTATNIVPESAAIDCELRGETTALAEYMRERAERVLESAATMYDCSLETETVANAPSATSDQALVDLVGEVAAQHDGVESVIERDDLGGSEDATYLMNRVQDQGGLASYVCLGTDSPGGHHTATFDVDEASIPLGVDLIAETVLELETGYEAAVAK